MAMRTTRTNHQLSCLCAKFVPSQRLSNGFKNTVNNPDVLRESGGKFDGIAGIKWSE